MYDVQLNYLAKLQSYSVANNSQQLFFNSSGYLASSGQQFQNSGSAPVAGSQQQSTSYDQELQQAFARMDSNANGGNGDGSVDVNEAYRNLCISHLFEGLDQNSNEYRNLKQYTDKIPAALNKYAGDDKKFTTQEWEQFLEGQEWTNVINTYHSSSNWAAIEMNWVDNRQSKDNIVTSAEVNAEIYSKFVRLHSNENSSILATISNLVNKYAGSDNKFTKEEYTKLLKDPTYAAFINKYTDCRPGTGLVA